MATNERARQLERDRLRRQAQRRAAAAVRQRRIALIAGGVVTLLVLGTVIGLFVTGSSKSAASQFGSTPSPSAPASPAASNPPASSPAPSVASSSAAPVGSKVCSFAADPTGRTGPGIPPDVKATRSHTATIGLTQGALRGNLTVALDAKAPCTVTSFTFLAGKKFFDGTTCHRLTTQGIYVLQCGDPKGDGTGGPGYTIPDENLTGATYPAGTVAMANTGKPHTGGSQFFLVYKATQLPPQYTPFGTITKGIDVLNKIAANGTSSSSGDGPPKTPVKITTFRVS